MSNEKNELILYSGHPTALYTAQVASQLAHVSLRFFLDCEREGLIKGYDMPGGTRGYDIEVLYLLPVIRRLQNDLGLDLGAIEIIMNMRQQISDLAACVTSAKMRHGVG